MKKTIILRTVCAVLIIAAIAVPIIAFGGGNASATELYQLQFLVGMLRVQATGGAKLSQQVNQGFESLLKQQG